MIYDFFKKIQTGFRQKDDDIAVIELEHAGLTVYYK